MPEDLASVRYMVDDVDAAIDFYTTHLGLTLRPMPDGRVPAPGRGNRIHLIVDDIAAEVERLRGAGLTFSHEVVTGPGGRQILVEDPSGNPVELLQAAA
jgi:catechol 2,3-dioxygenase-like lactoylglutathione lyase family enzyme